MLASGLQGNLPGGVAPRTPYPTGAALRAGVPMRRLAPRRPYATEKTAGFLSKFLGVQKFAGTSVHGGLRNSASISHTFHAKDRIVP